MGWFYTYAITIQQTGVFVPEWGWVGSEKIVGLIRGRHQMPFSSPSGDGLVLSECSLITLERSFRPRVGMGWFANYTIENLINDSFRPRVGMGWFSEI